MPIYRLDVDQAPPAAQSFARKSAGFASLKTSELEDKGQAAASRKVE